MKRNKYKEIITAYIKNNIANNDVAALLQDDNFNEYAYFYNCYPYLFVEAFHTLEKNKLELLNIAGFLCYKAIVLRDDYIDKIEPDNLDIKKNEISQLFLEEAKKILLKIFGKKSSFWSYWKKRKLELANTKELDKFYNIEDVTDEQYETFSENKSAFAKLAIDGLYVLSNENYKEAHTALTYSHKEFSIAMQLFDDLFDVEEDFQNKQFNLAIHNVQRHFKTKMKHIVSPDANTLEKHLFLSGIATNMLQKALLHLDNSEQYAKSYKVIKWIDVLNFYRKIFKGVLNQKEAYLAIVTAKVRHSHTKATNLVNELNVVPAIHNSLQNGIEFVVAKQRTDGTWFEYLTSAGASDIWATGFMTFFSNNIIPHSNIEKAKHRLHKEAHPLWGYKQSYLCDTDSSNFALLGLGQAPKSKYDRLILRQNINGGFPTYTEKEIKELRKYMKYPNEKQYVGWTQSHLCVSVVTYYLLLGNLEFQNTNHIKKLEAYLIRRLRSKDEIGYWWTDETYTLFWLSLAFNQIKNPKLSSIIKGRLINSVKDYKPKLNPDNINTKSIFYTALQLNICLTLDSLNIIKCQSLILILVKEILTEQYRDGSWDATNAMRLPDTDVISPSKINEWPASARGCNVRAVEFNRLFTTAVTLNSLNNYIKHSSI